MWQTGLTPLMEAASGGYVEVGRVLLDKGADIAAAPVPVSRDTALTIAADKGHHRFVELLLTRSLPLLICFHHQRIYSRHWLGVVSISFGHRSDCWCSDVGKKR